MRPVWALSGGEMFTQLDVLHAEIVRLQTRRLELIDGIEQIGYAKEIDAADTVQILAFRHRLDPREVRRDVKLANALPKYALLAAALPDPGRRPDLYRQIHPIPRPGQARLTRRRGAAS
jgi:hypothetical protein